MEKQYKIGNLLPKAKPVLSETYVIGNLYSAALGDPFKDAKLGDLYEAIGKGLK